MVTPRSGRHRRPVLLVLLTAVLVAVLGTTAALAAPVAPSRPAPTQPVPIQPVPIQPVPTQPAPAPPTDAAGAAAQLEQVQREAEALTEEWHAATDAAEARRAELADLRAAIEPARVAAEQATAAEEGFRVQVDALVASTFEGGNLDQFNALLASASPQDFLDQMSTLEVLADDQRSVLDELLATIEDTRAARAEAEVAAGRAQTAADAADAAEAEAAERKRVAELRIDEAEELLAQLSPAQRRDRARGADGPDGPVAGSGVGVEALNAAITQLGKDYRWGAEGPDSYDCSGLTSWAFSRAGVTLPRSSSQQAGVGRAVSRDEIRAGDLVFFYSPVSHVGIAVDNETVINAPQTGDVVKYSEIDRREFHSARRL